MRELTEAEMLAIYQDKRCPFCSAPFDQFEPGPRGGLSRNMTCASCAAMVNVLAPDYWDRYPGFRFGQLLREGLRR